MFDRNVTEHMIFGRYQLMMSGSQNTENCLSIQPKFSEDLYVPETHYILTE